MKKYKSKIVLLIALLLMFCFPSFAQQFRSTISGVVYDANTNRPVPDVYVELLNELYSTIRRVKTESSGRYFFGSLSQGNYKIKILTLGTAYLEQIQDAQIITFARDNNQETPDNIYLDFRLKLDPRKVSTNNGSSGVVFAQEIPPEAKKLYKKGLDELADKKDIGFETIDQALKIFPNYYEALDFVGNELVQKQQYEKALPYLIKAIDVNQRSFSSFYALGYACYKINKRPEAAEAFRASTILSPQSVNAHLFYGIILRLDGQYKIAETELLQAKNLSKDNPLAEIHWQLGLLYNKLNRNIEAANELETYLKLQPKSPDAEKIKELIAKLRSSK